MMMHMFDSYGCVDGVFFFLFCEGCIYWSCALRLLCVVLMYPSIVEYFVSHSTDYQFEAACQSNPQVAQKGINIFWGFSCQ